MLLPCCLAVTVPRYNKPLLASSSCSLAPKRKNQKDRALSPKQAGKWLVERDRNEKCRAYSAGALAESCDSLGLRQKLGEEIRETGDIAGKRELSEVASLQRGRAVAERPRLCVAKLQVRPIPTNGV
jgi:hypothetical protein